MFKLKYLFVMFAALSAVACGKFDSPDSAGPAGLLARKPFGACDRKTVPTINLCMEAVGPDYNEPGYLSILQSSCENSGGVFSTNNCDTTESFGTCVLAPGQPNLTYVSYYPPEYDATSAQTACVEAGGVYLSR